ncbi:MAG TPA: glycosyltransferase family 4 protein [Methanolinea sp.]|nr:glycosyltransferase family 4 protein [Methanolinea sp.]
MKPLNLLITTEFYYPSIGGVQEATKQLAEILVSRGHQVTIVTTKLKNRSKNIINNVFIKEFSITGNWINGFKGEYQEYQDYLRTSNFDVILNYAAQQWATDLMLPILDEIHGKKVLVPCGYSGLFSPIYQQYYENMKKWIREYDACVYLSNNYRDINFAHKFGVKNDIVIPNGASQKEFLEELRIDIKSILQIPYNHFLILHVGSHTGLKGHKEAIKIFKRAKITNSTLLIVGSNEGSCFNSCKRSELLNKYNPLIKYLGKNIIVTELSREQTIASFKTADIFLFPSRIECSPIVLFECMASGTPFLTTDVGNAPEIINWSNSGILLPTDHNNGYSYVKIRESAKVLEKIYSDNEMRDNMSKFGFNKWKEYFTWEKIAEGYEGLFYALLKNVSLEKLKTENPWKYWNLTKEA